MVPSTHGRRRIGKRERKPQRDGERSGARTHQPRRGNRRRRSNVVVGDQRQHEHIQRDNEMVQTREKNDATAPPGPDQRGSGAISATTDGDATHPSPNEARVPGRVHEGPMPHMPEGEGHDGSHPMGLQQESTRSGNEKDDPAAARSSDEELRQSDPDPGRPAGLGRTRKAATKRN